MVQGAFVYWSFLPVLGEGAAPDRGQQVFLRQDPEVENFAPHEVRFQHPILRQFWPTSLEVVFPGVCLGQTNRNNFVKKFSLQPRKVDLGLLLDHRAVHVGPFEVQTGAPGFTLASWEAFSQAIS